VSGAGDVAKWWIAKSFLGGLETECSGINHNRKGGAFEIEQPKVGPKGEPSGSERVKGHGEHRVKWGKSSMTSRQSDSVSYLM
jgi:hypothetical protein